MAAKGPILEQPMAKKTKIANSQLTAAVAGSVFDWRNVHSHEGRLIGKKRDKAGRWRTAKVPDYAGNVAQAYEIDERMNQLGKSSAYYKELARITKRNNLPVDWATPEQRSRAALTVVESKRKKSEA